jgi:hypothetical protein
MEDDCEVCGERIFTYEELKSDLDACIRAMSDRPHWKRPPTPVEMEMLRTAFEEFVSAMESR